jgi:hypothetical protein
MTTIFMGLTSVAMLGDPEWVRMRLLGRRGAHSFNAFDHLIRSIANFMTA